ncbi:DMT family transporter [Anaerosalibacter massiliensis]|uniref:DMT family transporter n=1 Tax=Anaerosalibacter massiliensis TaxID=1347392 RepID=A0A9X2S580_9FIRM|nr:DMT family transporter [Anaerosalibacter massiliensis]MCR2044325.1 DMT family transporter [Anaerosalibacter massiliensis]
MKILAKKKSLYADLSLLLVAIIWGSSFVVIKNALDYINPVYILVLRFALSSVLMAFVFWKRFRKINKEDIKAGAIIGFFLFLAFLTQTIGLKYTTVSKQAFITASYVVIVPFFYWGITKKKPDIYEFVAAILCLIGIGLLSLEEGLSINLGDGLTMVCAVFFALHIISIEYFAKDHDPIILTIVQFAVAAILSFIVVLIFNIKLGSFGKEVGFSILYVAVVSTLIAFGIQNVAQKYTSSTHTAIILSMESVFGSIFSVLLLGDKLTVKLFLGCLIVLLSILTAETKWNFLRKNN